MGSMVAVRMRILVVALALMAAACDGGGGDEGECNTCGTDEGCHGNQECVLAVDGNHRCFEPDNESCTSGRVLIARAATPTPTATP